MSLFAELKRRNVLRAGAAYAATSWLLIQVVETLFPVFGLPDTGVRLVVLLLAIGFLPVIAISWAFELTPEVMKRDSGAGEIAPNPGLRRTLDRAIVVILVIGISYFAFDKFVLTPARVADREAEAVERAKAEIVAEYFNERSIAVLPFLNLSDSPGQQHFVDGLTPKRMARPIFAQINLAALAANLAKAREHAARASPEVLASAVDFCWCRP